MIDRNLDWRDALLSPLKAKRYYAELITPTHTLGR
jgi:hypothetical protein